MHNYLQFLFFFSIKKEQVNGSDVFVTLMNIKSPQSSFPI